MWDNHKPFKNKFVFVKSGNVKKKLFEKCNIFEIMKKKGNLICLKEKVGTFVICYHVSKYEITKTFM